jgi:1,4-dihydroxy-6-naphthoate synthase
VVPGRLTTAFRVLGMVLGPEFSHRVLAFDRILDEVKSGRAEAGLLIHEGQLTYADEGLEKVLDLGEWWLLETGLPLPLGVNVVRRDVPRREELSDVLLESINAGLEHKDEATAYALGFARDLDFDDATQFIDMYVNELTCDYGDEGRKAVEEFLKRVRV